MAETSTVGGVISGYWAMGKPQPATNPARVMMMDITAAKIGRSIKNFENTYGPQAIANPLFSPNGAKYGSPGQRPGVAGREPSPAPTGRNNRGTTKSIPYIALIVRNLVLLQEH